MRDPARIKRICDKFAEVWEKHPDLRFDQLRQWAAGRGDSFYLDDDDFEAMLDDFLEMEARTR